MKPGTSPSINDKNDIAFQGSNGDLWVICNLAAVTVRYRRKDDAG